MIFFLWGMFLLLLMFLFFGLSLYFLLSEEIWLLDFLLFNGSSFGSFMLIFDWISLSFLSVIMLISFCVLIYSMSYMEGDKTILRFCYLILLFVFSMMMMVLSPNLMSLLLGWDGLGLVSYCLVIYYQNKRSYSAGMITVLSNRIGDVGILLGITFMFSLGSWNFLAMEFSLNLSVVEYYLMVSVILAAITKSAQIPFSAWLPAAMAAPTPVSSLVHSSTLVTAGVFLLVRFNDLMMISGLNLVLKNLSVATMLLAGLGACYESDMKKVVALSTLSQLGIMMFILSLGYWQLAYFHLLMHALFKALLFLCGGSVIHMISGGQDYRFMGNLLLVSPLVSSGVMISSMCLMGLPFLCGFYSKDLIFEYLFMSKAKGFLEMFFMLMIVFTTVIYSLRLIKNVFIFNSNCKSDYLSEESLIMNFSIFCLSVSSIFGGSTFQWLAFNNYEYISLSQLMKLLVFMLILVSLSLSLMKFLENLNVKFSEKNFFLSFFSLMWFLPNLSFYFPSKYFFFVSSLALKSDLTWHEEFGGEGVNFSLGILSKEMYFIQVLIKFSMILIMFFLLFYVMLFF